MTKRSGVTPRHLGLCLAAAACAGNAPPPVETGVVTGTVAYRERMALPPDAVVQVQLSDVSLQDAPAQVVADTTLSPVGRQVPLPFELQYDPAKIEPRRRYAVRATIRSEGRLLFTTDTHVPVLTEGHPSKGAPGCRTLWVRWTLSADSREGNGAAASLYPLHTVA